MQYETPQQARKRFQVGFNRIYELLAAGRVEGAVRVGATWRIPVDARLLPDPSDGRRAQPSTFQLPPEYR
jgi:hypothetical protein